MTYTPNVPQGNQQIASTQAPILANFTYINTAMLKDHAWNGNEINSQVAGTHQKISLPNQADLVGNLPAGINSIMYANSGNLFNYSGVPLSAGTKGIVSGSVVSGTAAFPTPNVAVSLTGAVIPNDCIGFAIVRSSNTLNIAYSNSFFRISGTFYSQIPYQQVGSSSAVISIGASGSQLQASSSVALGSMAFKVVWWPL